MWYLIGSQLSIIIIVYFFCFFFYHLHSYFPSHPFHMLGFLQHSLDVFPALVLFPTSVFFTQQPEKTLLKCRSDVTWLKPSKGFLIHSEYKLRIYDGLQGLPWLPDTFCPITWSPTFPLIHPGLATLTFLLFLEYSEHLPISELVNLVLSQINILLSLKLQDFLSHLLRALYRQDLSSHLSSI